MKKLETKEFYYQTDPTNGQVYLYPTVKDNGSMLIRNTGNGKALLTILEEESIPTPPTPFFGVLKTERTNSET